MDPLEWYERMHAAHQQSAYALAWHLCRDDTVVVRRVIPAAVEIACKSIRNRNQREDPLTGFKITLSDAQLLQIGVLEAATREAVAPDTASWLPYVARLTLCTLPLNSFSVAVGFGRFLTNGTRREVLDLHSFLDPGGSESRDDRAVRTAMSRIKDRMSEWFPASAFTEIPKQPGDARYSALARMVPWESDHLPDTEPAFSAQQATRLQAMTQGNSMHQGRWLRRRGVPAKARAAVDVTAVHVCIDQQCCLERVKEWGVVSAQSFAAWRIPSLPGMQGNFDVGPWDPPGGSHWDQINEDIMREINWRQTQARRRSQRLGATLEVRVDGRVQAVITPAERNGVTIALPASARYVEIQDPVGQELVATCHLMDPHDLPPEGWQRAVRLPDGGRLQCTFSANPDPETAEAGLRMTVRVQPAFSMLRAGIERVRAWFPPATPERERVPPRWALSRSRWAPGWVTGAVMGLPLLAMGVVLTLWLSTPSQATPQVTVAVSLSHLELISLEREVKHQLERAVGATIVFQPINPSVLVPILDQMVATNTPIPWDVISVDNDTLGLLAQKGLVQPLSRDEIEKLAPPDPLFQDLREEFRVDGRDYFVPFRANVKLMYFNEHMLKEVGHDRPPETWDELEQLAHRLASDDRGRVALQAHPGKAAAVTVFEWVTSMGGDPLTLEGSGARQAFKRLWRLAPVLEPASTTIQFNTANDVLITNRVAVVDNWTYGIKEVMRDFGKTHITVTPGLRGSVHVLGGDVLAIPTGVPKERKDRALRLIERLVAKETQYTLAHNLYWVPVREDVYPELSAPQGLKAEYFRVIREALGTAVMRPITPSWGVVERVLSEALQTVLQRGQAQQPPEDEAAFNAEIDDLLRPYIARLQAIPREYTACAVVPEKTAGAEGCQVSVPKETSFKDLAPVLAPDFGKIEPALLAEVNGRGELEIVSPKTMHKLLVPEH